VPGQFVKAALNYRVSKPNVPGKRICTNNLDKEQAPLGHVYICLEQLYSHSSNVLSTSSDLTRLTIPDTELIDGFLRAPFGSYYINALRRRNHYENSKATISEFISMLVAVESQFEIILVLLGSIKLDEGGYQFLLLNGIDHKGLNESMCFEEVANDVLFPDTGMVPRVNKRGNRATTIGYTPSNSTIWMHGRGGIAEPTIMAGTRRYQPTFLKMTNLARELSALGSFPLPYSNLDGVFAKRPEFSADIVPGNIIECLAIGTYIHDLLHVVEFQDILCEHLDWENCPHETWDVTVVSSKTFFCGRLGRNVTVFIANSRKFISEALKRRNRISLAARKLLGPFDQQPEHMKYVTPASLCPMDYPGRYRVVPVHFEPMVDLSPLLFHLFKIRDWLWRAKSKIFPNIFGMR
jgi:hypothetical protein